MDHRQKRTASKGKLRRTHLSTSFEELVAEYLKAFPQRSAELLNALDAVVSTLRHQQTSDWDTLEKLSHTLAGSAGTYGFTPISKHLSQLEDLISLKLKQQSAAQSLQHLERWKTKYLELAQLMVAPKKAA